MVCEFSETQFAFGIVFEIVKKNCISKGYSAPLFPTQAMEGEFGYDMQLNGKTRTLFLQFKVPEKKTTKSAKYWKDHNQAYYEFKIYPQTISNQHNALVKLAKEDERNRVYYCSPGFITCDEYNEYYRRSKIDANSIYVPLNTMNKISGSDWHSVSYTLSPYKYSRMHSDSEDCRSLTSEEFYSDIAEMPSYDSFESCVSSLAERFEVDVSGCENNREKAHAISSELMARYNLNLLLLPS
ncbi:MAG: hypothetical protein K5770_07115 [Lachnospiraceae bacterium]|nr:hypothetical protein [Lachnospiraceae bacterium]